MKRHHVGRAELLIRRAMLIAGTLAGAAGLAAEAGATAGISRGDRYSGEVWASRSPVLAQHGMAATEQPLASFGLMGGDMQPQGHVQVLVNMIDFGMNVQEAGDAARWRHYGNAEPTGEKAVGIGTVEMESGFDPGVKAELERRGYTVVAGTGNFGGYEAIRFDAKQRVYAGATEMRKDGEVIGY